ncbi:hypothetical protein ACFFTN_01530 [Aminobacter aganoensis]|uniref:Uncharacterized protein n=1 Tax=Aminobacter aganoensis TaxID=83264 RepID=A0A7X0KJV9_9HYPH|nr:hypothetical protein [Aminobacter aganoensis]MBB6353457.1 hypothetical protein [Aminobacter aganoensis]
MAERDFDKQFDLEPSEFRREDQPEPFFGFGAPDWSVLVIQIGIGIYVARWSHWLVDTLTDKHGLLVGLAIFGVIACAGIYALKLIGDLIIFLVPAPRPPRPPQ